MLTLLIKRDLKAGCYTATATVDGKPCEKTIEIFGTHILPTAFRLEADIEEVAQELRLINPNSKIVISN